MNLGDQESPDAVLSIITDSSVLRNLWCFRAGSVKRKNRVIPDKPPQESFAAQIRGAGSGLPRSCTPVQDVLLPVQANNLPMTVGKGMFYGSH
jgi:hypothetical protein